MHKRLALILLSLIIFLAGCDYSKKRIKQAFSIIYLLNQWTAYFTFRQII